MVIVQHFPATKIKNIPIYYLPESHFDNYQFFPLMTLLREIIELYLQ